jgi:fatty acid desaturase
VRSRKRAGTTYASEFSVLQFKASGPLPPGSEPGKTERSFLMIWTIAVILLILWLLGFFAFHISSGLIHILLVIAVIVILVRLIQGRRL